MTPSGPCMKCGATNYALSMGGPGICPSCDCGGTSSYALQRNVTRLTESNAELRAALNEAIREIVDWSVRKHLITCEYGNPEWDSDSVPDPKCWCQRDLQRWGDLANNRTSSTTP